MARKRPERTPLMVRVCAELGRGLIEERFIAAGPKAIVYGICEGRNVTINAATSVVDTVIHELLHRMFPHWSENYVRNRTSWLKNQMSDAEVQAFYECYQRCAVRRKSERRLKVRGL